MEYVYLLINSLLYLFLLFYYYKVAPKSYELLFLVFLWFVTSIFSIIHRSTDLYSLFFSENQYQPHQHPITLFPFLFLFFLFVVYTQHFKNVNSYRIHKIKYNKTIILYLSIIISLCSYLPFIENVIHVFRGGVSNLSDFAQSYGTGEIVNRAHMSFFGARLNSVIILTSFINPILMFLYMNRPKRNAFVTLGLLFAVLNIPIASFSNGSRGVALAALIYIIYIYLLMRNTLNISLQKSMKIILSGLVIFIGFILFVFTISRFTDKSSSFSDFSVLDWVATYAGESFNNYNTDMWWIKHNTNGANCFADLSLFGEIKGRDIDKLANITKVRMHVFYTGFGDLQADFGKFGILIITLLLSVLMKFTLKINDKSIMLSNLILLALFGYFIAFGMFFFAFILTYRTLMITIMFIIFLKLNRS